MTKVSRTIKVGESIIGSEYPAYFIADIAANHDGSIERAKELIKLAKASGADAVKFQHHDVDKYVSDKGFKGLGGKFSHQQKWDKSIFEVYKDAEVKKAWTAELKECSDSLGIDFFSTPYDLDMVDHLSDYVSAYKVGSGDVAWDAMLEKVASTGKPVLFASGAASLEEVIHAYDVIFAKSSDIVLLQCNTNYTGSVDNFKYINLNVLKTYRTLFPDTILGLSDHTPGHETVLGAVALGAKVVEKHFTDDTTRRGPDHPFSMDPKTWRKMVKSTRILEASLGGAIKKVEDNEIDTVILQRRAVRAIRNISSGEILNRNMIEFQRPCPKAAMTPNEFVLYEGKELLADIEEGDFIRAIDCIV